mmetsp:Transcript_52597/g.114741  ORF Transcript_52597/g.114741 Transcript_52597/m.114741 type:complete len:315 (-) Transcript_52597:123-1067(-)
MSIGLSRASIWDVQELELSQECLEAHLLKGVVAEGNLVVVVVVVVGEGALRAEECEGGSHGGVLVFERELALVRVGRHDSLHHLSALWRHGVRRRLDDLAADGLDDVLSPLGNVHLGHLVGGHVRHDRELLHAGGEDHLADVARAALAVLRALLRVGVHRRHRKLQQLQVAIGRLNSCAEEFQAAHIRGALNLNALLAALLDHLLQQLLPLLRSLLHRVLLLLLWSLLLLLLLCRRLSLLAALLLVLLIGLGRVCRRFRRGRLRGRGSSRRSSGERDRLAWQRRTLCGRERRNVQPPAKCVRVGLRRLRHGVEE